jgi:hypothetical protein
MAANPPYVRLKPQKELIWTAKLLTLNTELSDLDRASRLLDSCVWEFKTGRFTDGSNSETTYEGPTSSLRWTTPGNDDDLLKILMQLQKHMPDSDDVSVIAASISRAMDQTISLLNQVLQDYNSLLRLPGKLSPETMEFTWSHLIYTSDILIDHDNYRVGPSKARPLYFSCAATLLRNGVSSTPRADFIYAVLRLWLDTIPLFDISTPENCVRLLGKVTDFGGRKWLLKRHTRHLFSCPYPDGKQPFPGRRAKSDPWFPLRPVFGVSGIPEHASV